MIRAVGLALLILLGLLSLGALLLGARLLRARRAPETRSGGSPAAAMPPRPPPAPPPPPSPEQRMRTALAQEAFRALRAWLDALERCPACGAREPKPEVPPPAPAPGGPPAAPAFFFQPQGPLLRARRGLHRVDARLPDGRGYGFEAWFEELRCTACAFALSFPSTDAPPVEPVTLPAAEAPPARRRLRLEGLKGEPGGWIEVGGGAAAALEADGEAGARERGALAIGAALLEAIDGRDLRALEEGEAEAMRRELLGGLLPTFGGRLVEAPAGAEPAGEEER